MYRVGFASTMAASMLKNCTVKQLQSLLVHFRLRNCFYNYKGVRFLLTQETLGIPGYISMKEKTEYQFQNVEDEFKKRMFEYLESPEKLKILTQDIINVIYLMKNEKDVSLCVEMSKRFNEQNKGWRISTYSFGPIIMRACHYLQFPHIAFTLLTNEEFEGLFDQISSFTIALDLLYEHGQYEKLLEVFEIMKNKQIHGYKFPINGVLLAFAACYKMNTPDSYKYALKILQEANEMNAHIHTKALTFLAALAVKQNDPSTAMEILVSHPSNKFTRHNIRLMAMADLDQLDDAFIILNGIVSKDFPTHLRKGPLSPDACEKLRAAAARSGNKETIHKMERILQAFDKGDELDKIICSPILGKSDYGKRTDIPIDRSKEFKTSHARRKGLYDME